MLSMTLLSLCLLNAITYQLCTLPPLYSFHLSPMLRALEYYPWLPSSASWMTAAVSFLTFLLSEPSLTLTLPVLPEDFPRTRFSPSHCLKSPKAPHNCCNYGTILTWALKPSMLWLHHFLHMHVFFLIMLSCNQITLQSTAQPSTSSPLFHMSHSPSPLRSVWNTTSFGPLTNIYQAPAVCQV